MASNAQNAPITTQPTTRRKELETFASELDPNTVIEWTVDEVVDKYLVPMDMEFMAKAFRENHITGAALLAMTEEHMKEMGCAVLGDRIAFINYLDLLKRHKREADRSKSLWSGVTPVKSCAYHNHCGSFMLHVLCPCCVPLTEWRITGQGIRYRKNPATLDCCGAAETEFIDFRFMKDIELQKQARFCCCCVGYHLRIYADDKDTAPGPNTHATSDKAALAPLEREPLTIFHPDAPKAEAIIRNAWGDAQLVAN
ncbi:hypothetical protein EMCRGX_G023406 [Ephydatia muelleri]